jgi:putative ABC transport system permease protein
MRFFLSVISLFVVAAKRLWHQRLLMLCLLAGLIIAVGLLASIPLYADAVNNRLLQGELTEAGTYRPPFSFLWRYIGAWHGEIPWSEYEPLNEYLVQQSPTTIDLPIESQVRHVSTSKLRLFPSEESSFIDDIPLLWAGIGFISGLEGQIQLLEGSYPLDAPPDGMPQVLVSRKTANELGLQIGERYTLFGSSQDNVQIPIRIAGVWQAIDPSNAYWFYQPDAFDEILLTTEETFKSVVAPALETPVDSAVWSQNFDGRRIRPANVGQLLNGVASAESRVTALLNDATLDASPAEALRDYAKSSGELSIILTIFSLPIVGLVLYFIVLIAGMVVRREQSEIAIMRSRGTTRGQILIIYLLEGLLISSLGLVGGLVLASWLARLMGQTRSFLDLSLLSESSQELVTVLSASAIQFGLLAIALALLALLLPALAASRYTIISLRWEQARALKKPFWQRYYLDLLLLIPPLYGWYQLNRQGAVALLGSGDDPFSNPLLFLVPILFCFALGLTLMRLFPLVMSLLALLAEQLPSTPLLLTSRQLARSAGLYTGPLLLLCLTVSLAFFTASMAFTLDSHLRDQVYYQVGADLNLAELGENTESTQEQQTLPGQEAVDTSGGGEQQEEPQWLFLPVGEHLRVPGVQAAARVGDYSATTNIGGRQQSGRVLGIDRLDFPQVAFFRADFAQNEPLGAIMNRLAVNEANLIISRDFLARHNLQIGDPLGLTVGVAGQFAEIDFIVAGALDLFPTQYPVDGPFFVANLDYLYEGLGGTYPYDVWLATDPVSDNASIVAGVRQLGLSVVATQDSRESILNQQNRPERQGLFGVLSVGFMAAAALTVLGFLVYAVVSFQRRFIELGMLRAIGLSVGQMSAYLAGEQALLILTGIALGTALGWLASVIFIPFFQIGGDKTALVPPFVVEIAWEQLGTIYVIFGLMFVIAVVVLFILLLRMKIFEAVKMGEAV